MAMRKLNLTLLVVFSASLFSAAVLADGQSIYKWTDSQGVVHYSDKAPATAQPNVALITLPALPAPDPQAQAREQARIASINQWYQNLLKLQTEQQTNQRLAWEAALDQQAASTPEPSPQVSYVQPVYWLNRPFGFRHRSHFMHFGPQPRPSPAVFQSNIWSTQANPFTQSLYKP